MPNKATRWTTATSMKGLTDVPGNVSHIFYRTICRFDQTSCGHNGIVPIGPTCQIGPSTAMLVAPAWCVPHEWLANMETIMVEASVMLSALPRIATQIRNTPYVVYVIHTYFFVAIETLPNTSDCLFTALAILKRKTRNTNCPFPDNN